MSEAPKFMMVTHQTLAFLDSLADRLDEWAEQSRKHGWSTHQVDANISAANDCRRAAAKLRDAIKHGGAS